MLHFNNTRVVLREKQTHNSLLVVVKQGVHISYIIMKETFVSLKDFYVGGLCWSNLASKVWDFSLSISELVQKPISHTDITAVSNDQ